MNCEIENNPDKDKNETLRPGEKYKFTWDEGSTSQGEILEVEENESITFTFTKAKVRVSVKEDDKGILLSLKHYDIQGSMGDKQASQLDCCVGWTYYLTNLRAVIEKGVDSRDKNPECAGTLAWGIYPPKGIILD